MKSSQKSNKKDSPDDKVYREDPIFMNVKRKSSHGRKTKWSIDHDKALYDKP